jgi:prepilin-type N-terminal cleavage/methylation domain-containing protein
MLKFQKKKSIEFVLPLRPLRSPCEVSPRADLCGEKFFGLPRVARGFTLVELMIVMGVIIILVAMVLPVIIGAKDKARKKQALAEAHNIVLALKGYHMEFGKWPNQSQADNDTTYFADNHLVIQPLIGHNPRGKVFLAIQLLSTNTSGGSTNITGQTDNLGNLVDPWGVPYVVCLDENMNGACLINVSNVLYTNNFTSVSNTYWATNYPVPNIEAVVASFVKQAIVDPTNTPFDVETWSEPQ